MAFAYTDTSIYTNLQTEIAANEIATRDARGGKIK
jgi:hypothetical protein